MMVIIWLAVGGVDTQAAGPEASPAVVVRDQPPGPPPPTNAAQPEPTRLRIPRLSVDVAVVPTGVDTDGQMTLPERVDYVGWYGFGPAPGVAAGSAVLAGHVDSRVYGIGPLSRLSAATRGDEVVVQRQGGSVLTYRVISVEQVHKRTLSLDRLFARAGAPILRILTCGGPYSPGAGYRDNVVVTAAPMA
jgi:Sortase domain